ncbi:hypothetical protein GF391_03750 [Candidatus Uhrbacteria bacterium]|nr:hypothetical protein [Candidatus Uhrbacteria bacterium]
MKLLLKTATIALTLATLAGCASSSAPAASQRDAYLNARAELPAEQGVDCGQKGGRCTVHFHADPETRPELKVGATEFPLELPKPEHLSSR